VIYLSTLSNIQKAARVLKKGGLVAFPTETVYGLGADALNARAVAKIFQAKGRPSDNPLIVHIADMRELTMVARDVPEVAKKLMKEFWAGPLTFVLPKTAAVPNVVTAGGKTVAVRMPAHKIARALIKAAGCPVAAPSANLAGKPSPTCAAHVEEDLGDTVDMILDGGKTLHGLESTVVDVCGRKVEILRTGAITSDMLAKVLGYKPKIVRLSPNKKGTKLQKVRSPGMKYKHYAPKVKLYLLASTKGFTMVRLILKKMRELHKNGLRVGILCSSENKKFYSDAGAEKIVLCGSQKNPASIGNKLFASLRLFDPQDVDVILAESFGSEGVGQAVMDRLERAATQIL